MSRVKDWKKVFISIIIGSMLVLGMTLNGQAAVTLEVWDQWMGVKKEAIEMLDANFQRIHPGVKIERSTMPAEQMADKMRPALATGRGPDVLYPEVTITFLGPLVKAGLIMDLTDVWKERGWDEKLVSMSKDIPTFGGRTWGIGHELEFVPIYYNKQIFARLGIKPPKSIAELEQIAEKALAAGYIPMAWSARNWWPRTNFFASIVWSFLGKDMLEEIIYQGGTWKVPEFKEAVRKAFVEWPKRNFYIPNAAAVSYDEGNMLFYQQQAAMHPTGNWIIANYVEYIKDFEVGTFLWPRPDPNQASCTVSFCGSGYVVSGVTKHRDLAIDYVDYLMASEEAARIWYEVAATIPPLRMSVTDLKIHPLVSEALDQIFGGKAQFVPGASMNTPPEAFVFLQKGVAEVLTGQITVEKFVDEWERLWEKGRRERLSKDTFKLE